MSDILREETIRRATIFLAISIVVLGIAYWLGNAFDNRLNLPIQRVSPIETVPLRFSVEKRGEYWRVSWIRDPSTLSKGTAILSIWDGVAENKVSFDLNRSASMTVLYGPTGNDVTFQLAVGDQQTVSKNDPAMMMKVPVPAPQPKRQLVGVHPSVAVKDETESTIRRVVPSVPASARKSIQGTIRIDVEVTVNRSGEVTGTGLRARPKSSYFVRLAMSAAKEWRFPSGNAGFRLLRFEFSRDGERVSLLAPAAP